MQKYNNKCAKKNGKEKKERTKGRKDKRMKERKEGSMEVKQTE